MRKLSVIIPVYNEEKTILKVINKVKKSNTLNLTKEIIVIDDCSKDNTKNILKKIKEKQIKIFYHSKNMGKGSAIRTGLKNSTGDLVLIQDADLEYNPNEYSKLLKPILENKADVVYGTRLEAIQKNQKNMYKLHYFGNLFLTFLTNLLYGTKITDMETGYKLFKRKIIKGINLKARRFDFEPEITAKVLKKGIKIYELPINFTGRKFDEGKKITWKDGLAATYYLLKYRFSD